MNHEFQNSLEITVYGNHAVEAALSSERCSVKELWSKEPLEGVRSTLTSRQELDRKAGTDRHQGIVAKVQVKIWGQIEDWQEERAPHVKGALRVLAMDGIEDPQNLGALMRSAHFFGFHAVMFPKDRSAQLNGTSAKASTGAFAEVDIIRCTNISRELMSAEKLAFWRIGLKPDSPVFQKPEVLKNRPVILVVGSEGEGMRRNVEDKCDELVSIPSVSGRESLNASVAGGIAMYVYRS